MTMMASRRWFEAAGALVPMAVDLFIDGLLIAIGLAAGVFGGMLLLDRAHDRGALARAREHARPGPARRRQATR